MAYRRPVIDPNNPSNVTYTEDPQGMPECDTGSTPVNGNVPETCWYLGHDTTKCPVNGQIIQVARSAADIQQYGQQLPAGTKVGMQCRTCTGFLDQNNKPLPGCN